MTALPKPFERRLLVRGYEMNASGSVPPAVLARYAEHVRWEGLRSADYGLSRYWQRGVIRAQRLQAFSRVQYGSELDVSMWVARVGRTSFDLANRLEVAGTGRLVALVVVTVVNLGDDGRPSPVQPGFEQYIKNEALPEVEPPGKPAPENAFLRELQVAPSDQDVLGHVNHARYLDFVEDTRCFAAHAGAFGDDLSGAQKSARRIAVDYDQEATFGERLQILTWAAPGTGVFNVQIRRASDGSVVTRAQVSMT